MQHRQALVALSKIEQSRGRIDRHCTVGEIDFVDNFLDGRNQVFFAPTLHQIEFAAGSGQSGLHDPDALTTRGKNLKADDLIVIVLAGGQTSRALSETERVVPT